MKNELKATRCIKTNKQGTIYEAIVVTLTINEKEYVIGQVFANDVTKALLDQADIPSQYN